MAGGYDSSDEAAKAQYGAYDSEYQATVGKALEVAGAILEQKGSYFFTTVTTVDSKFAAQYIPGKSIKTGGYSWAGFTHTHPHAP